MSKFSLTIHTDDASYLNHITVLADVILHKGIYEPDMESIMAALSWLQEQLLDVNNITWPENREATLMMLRYSKTWMERVEQMLVEAETEPLQGMDSQ